MAEIKTIVKDMEVKIAVIEHGLADIRRRLDNIEYKIEGLSAALNHGIGAWRLLLLLASGVVALAGLMF